MTEYQKNKIFEFRLQGMGYKAIGNILGLSRDIVRNFCKRCGLNGSAEVIQKNINIRIDKGILCFNCGKPIKQSKHGRKRRFCSDICRRDWWRKNLDKSYRKETAMYKCVCRSCGKEFISYGNKNRRYCCHSCYIADRFGGNDDEI